MKNKHLAIVLTKKDSPKNGVLTVIPLSSKSKPYYLSLGSILSEKILPHIVLTRRELQYYIDHMEHDTDHLKNAIANLDEFAAVISIYGKMDKNTYALVQNIAQSTTANKP